MEEKTREGLVASVAMSWSGYFMLGMYGLL
jgi:hypothetical protein